MNSQLHALGLAALTVYRLLTSKCLLTAVSNSRPLTLLERVIFLRLCDASE